MAPPKMTKIYASKTKTHKFSYKSLIIEQGNWRWLWHSKCALLLPELCALSQWNNIGAPKIYFDKQTIDKWIWKLFKSSIYLLSLMQCGYAFDNQ